MITLPFGRVICLSDLGNILIYYLDKTTLLYKYYKEMRGRIGQPGQRRLNATKEYGEFGRDEKNSFL